MGFNYDILIIKDESKSKEKLAAMVLNFAQDFEFSRKNVQFIDVINSQKHASTATFAISHFNEFIILADEKSCISNKICEKSEQIESILRISVNSTTGIEFIEYREYSKIKRQYYISIDEDLDIKSRYNQEQIDEESKEIGQPYWFEQNGKDSIYVLKTYGFEEKELWNITWNIFEK